MQVKNILEENFMDKRTGRKSQQGCLLHAQTKPTS
jgi:hypothetical protein